MKHSLDFEPPVIEAIHAGQKIKAIKLLRESRGLDLSEAKALVEQYCREKNISPPPRDSSGGIFGLIILAGLIYLAYRFLFN